MGPLVFGQYADECLYLTKLVMIFGPLEMLSKLQLHRTRLRNAPFCC
jgi:hypothetical protein